MRIGKQDEPHSAISTSTADSVTVRGLDLCRDVIGKMDFTSYFWLLVTGREATSVQKLFADATLASIAEHGLVPSVVAARMTHAAAPEAFQAAVAAGLLGCGSVVLGSSEVTGRFLAELAQSMEDEGLSADAAVERGIQRLRAQKRRVPGFGHPLHSAADPRAERLLALADEHGVAGRHVSLLRTIHRRLPDLLGKGLPVNVNGAIPAVMLDVGFPLAALKGIALLARTASLIGHLQEESERPIGFVLSGKAAEAISYDGPGAQSGDP
jgi:citrate synthase